VAELRGTADLLEQAAANAEEEALRLLGFERAPAGLAEAVCSAVDELIERQLLTSSGPHLHLA